MENGKPAAEARGEVLQTASFFRFYAAECQRVFTLLLPPTATPGLRQMIRRDAVGVVAAITPWNFPSSMIGRKISKCVCVWCASVGQTVSLTLSNSSRMCALVQVSRTHAHATFFFLVSPQAPPLLPGAPSLPSLAN
jgi:succinate-semialdehyde dehydrogenase/glutarate-semialdehyde dehydrogenase